MSVFDEALDALFGDEDLAIAAVVEPAGGGAGIAVRSLLAAPDLAIAGGITGARAASRRIEVRRSDLPEVARGDRVAIGVERFIVSSAAIEDPDRRVWTLDLNPEPA